jgi:predicted PurR-regulated permease PerM
MRLANDMNPASPSSEAPPRHGKGWPVWACVAIAASWILAPFLSALAWACILAHVTWPMHSRLMRKIPTLPKTSAVLSSAAIATAVVLPLVSLSAWLRADTAAVAHLIDGYLDRGMNDVLDGATGIPLIGPAIHDWFAERIGTDASLRDFLKQWAAEGLGTLLSVLGGVGRNAARFGLAIIFLYVLYRHGEEVTAGLRRALQRTAGAEGERWIRIAAAANRAVMLSLLLAAVLQGIVAGIGYWLVGIKAPLLLGLVTAVASLLPMVGTFLVWGPASLVLLSTGHPLAALSLLGWGTLLVHPLDNVLRPLFISSAVDLPFLLVFLGVVGGIAAFGLVGLVIGPVALAVCWSMAREAWPPPEHDSDDPEVGEM